MEMNILIGGTPIFIYVNFIILNTIANLIMDATLKKQSIVDGMRGVVD